MRRRSPRLPRFRSWRRSSAYYPRPRRFRWAEQLIERHRHRAAIAARVLLTLAVVAHLAAAALLPGGRNALFGLKAGSVLSYLTLLPAAGTMGFYKTAGKDGFLVYKIYTEQGTVVEGAFPDQGASPRLRYDRLAMLAHRLSEDNPQFHTLFLSYLVDRLPGTPVKLEMHSAKWAWEGRGGETPVNDGEDRGILVLRKLGTYDGLRKSWVPAGRKGKK